MRLVIKTGIIIITVVMAITFASCQDLSSCAGKYNNGDSFIQLNSNGSFEASNVINISGTYKVDGENVEFHIKKLNGKGHDHKAAGMLKDDVLTGPDGIKYKRKAGNGKNDD